jgi:arylesterase/paraoxonase
MKKYLIRLFMLTLLLVFGYWVYDSMRVMGMFRTVKDQFAGTTQRIEAAGLVGVEDISVDFANGVAYLSATDRRAQQSGKSPMGAIFRYDLRDPSAVPQRISSEPESFAPHGLSLWRSPSGELELYVIDHGQGQHRVRRFRVSGQKLELLQIFESALLVSPNDLAVVGPGRFYVTNDHYFVQQPWRMLEDYLRLPLSQLIYFDQGQARVAQSGFAYANGVAWHAGLNTLFVAALGSNEIRAFQPEPDGSLREQARFDADSAVDNIEIGTDGNLWIGAHPKPLQFVQHAKTAAKLSPSQVLRMNPQTGAVVVVYQSLGHEISGSSVGAQWHERLLIGSVFEPFILSARMPK